MDLESIVSQVIDVAREVGSVLERESKRWQDIRVERKVGGDNPGTQVVTEVDRRLEKMLKDRLQAIISPDKVGWLGEEGGDDGSRLNKDYFWCVDPLDGTQAFVEGKPGISISIGLVSLAGEALLGVVYDPIERTVYRAIKGGGCKGNEETLRVVGEGKVHIYWDRTWQRHPQGAQLRAHLENLGWLICEVPGGAVMNVVQLLSGRRGAYFKFPKKSDGGGSLWDFAATVSLFQEAGGLVTDIRGDALFLNAPETTFMNHLGVIYGTDREVLAIIMKLWSEPEIWR